MRSLNILCSVRKSALCAALSSLLILAHLPASAAEPESPQPQQRVVFLPFHVQVHNAPPHLADGLASVLAGRVAAQSRISAITQGKATEEMRQALERGDHSAFGRLLAETGADYLVLGNFAPSGPAQYEVSSWVFAKSGGTPQRNSRFFANADDPLPAVEELAADVSAALSGRSGSGASPFSSANPERAYRRDMLAESVPGLEQGVGGFRLVESLKGRSLGLDVRDMGIADVNGDGRRNLVLLAEKSLEVYRYEDGQFIREFGQKLPGHLNHLALTMVDANGNGVPELYVGASNGAMPASSVWEWRGGGLERLEENVPWYLHAVEVKGEAMLLGQQPPVGEIAGGKIYLMRYEGDRLTPSGSTLPIIEGYNVYDVMPVDLDGDGSLEIVALSRDNRLEVFKSGAQLWSSADRYGIGRNYYGTVSAVAQAAQKENMRERKEPTFLHTRIAVADLDLDGLPDVVVGKNRQVTKLDFLPSLRYFDGSTIAGLKWDGHGMRVLWETRRHPGYTIAYQAVPDPAESRLELFFAAEDSSSFFGFLLSPDTSLHRLVLAVEGEE